MEILNRIINTMKEQNIKPKDLCAYLGLNQQQFTNWKNGNNKSYTKYMNKIAEFLNVSITYLYGIDETLPTTPVIDFELSEEEKDILMLFHNLNDEQKSKAKSYILNLSLEA